MEVIEFLNHLIIVITKGNKMKNKATIIMVLSFAFLCLVSGCGNGQQMSGNEYKETMAETEDIQSVEENEQAKSEDDIQNQKQGEANSNNVKASDAGTINEGNPDAENVDAETELEKNKSNAQKAQASTEDNGSGAEETSTETAETESGTDGDEENQEVSTPETEQEQAFEILNFVDIHGKEHQAQINPKAKKHSYIIEDFQLAGEKMTYVGDSNYTYRLGVDVSHYQGSIDWNKVKAAGYDFAFIRIGYRGYGTAGTLGLDKEFRNNIQNAKAAGLDVGVYFFAQAVNEAEALEEAQFVLDNLAGEALQMSIVYDPETIEDAQARTDNVTGEQFTKNTITFCNAVKNAGYEPMVYSNMLWEAFELDLEQLEEYPIWYADYESLPQTPYSFSIWQYTNKGRVDGISGNVDLNIQLIPVAD